MMSDSSEISLDKQIKTDEHVRHVTIRQIFGAERKHDSAPWVIEHREVSAVMIVANILDFTQNKDGALDFLLDDGTGRIKGSMGNQKSVELSFNHFAYVRVVGTISQPRSREVKYFNATGLAEVTDPHEIFYHCLEAIQHSLLIKMLSEVDHKNNQENTQERPSTEKDLNHIRQGDVLYHHEGATTSGPETFIQETVDDSRSFEREPFATLNYDELERHEDPGCFSLSHERTLSSDSFHTAHSRRSTSPESQSGYGQEMALDGPGFPSPTRQRSCARIRDPYQNLSNLHRDIILAINNGLENMAMDPDYDLRNGVHINLIVSGLQTKYGNHLNKQEVGDAIEYLLDEAYIFTTIDDRHYKVNV